MTYSPALLTRITMLGMVLGCAVGMATVPTVSRAAEGMGPLTIHARPMDDRKAVYGTVEATDTQQARARIDGTVGRLAVDEGDPVSDGQVLAVIADPKLALKLQSIQAGIASLQAERAQAAIDLNRASRLYKSGVVAKARLDTARTAVEVLDRNIAAQKAQADVVSQQSAEGSVKAPGNGKILEVLVTPGAVVLPGEPIATIATGTSVLRIEVPERHARFIRQGDDVTLGPRGLDAKAAARSVRQGIVSKVYPRLQNGRVIADITAPGLDSYFVGERTLVWISTGTRPAILIPPSYILVRFGITMVTLQSGETVVVQTGQTRSMAEGDEVEILSGLNDGDVIVPPAAESAVSSSVTEGGAS